MTQATSADGWAGVTLRFDATAASVRAVLQDLSGHLSPVTCDPDLLGSTEIVLAEALNNVVEHAYSDREDGKIILDVTRNGSRLIIEIRDTGAPMPGLRLPEAQARDTDVARDELPEGGFGWFLIRELVAELSYRRQDGENVVRIGMQLS